MHERKPGRTVAMSNEQQSMSSDPWSLSLNQWSISSNSGWHRFDVVLDRAINEDVCIASLAIEGRYWERSKRLQDADMTTEYSVSLPQVLLSFESLDRLWRDLHRWREEGTHFSRDLIAPSSGQELIVTLGFDPEFIYTVDKPTFGIAFSNGSMSGKWRFVVDQSCVYLAIESIQRALSAVREPS